MKRKLLFIFSLILGINGVNAQCSVNSAPTNNCASFSDYINSYTLDGIAATGVTGCSTAGYGTFATPVWNLQLGNTYTFTSSMGTGNNTFAMWIDLNNDAVYQSSEMIWASAGAAGTHTGSITIPLNSTPANGVRMRLRTSYLHVFTGGEACTNGVGTWGETEDHFVNLIPQPCTGTPGANSVVTSTSAICPEVAVSMSLANTYTNSGITYQWQSSTVAAAGPWTSINNATTTAYTGTSNVTTYYSVAIYCAGQGSLQATAGQVTVRPTLVVSGASTVCWGQNLSITVSGADTYTWGTGENTAAVSVTPNVTTNYAVKGYEIASGCTNTTAVTVAVDQCVGIGKVNAASGISIYPNPNNGLFTVEMNTSPVKSVQVVDLMGRVILTQTTSDTTLSFNINAFANGIYYVKAQSNDNTQVIKIVKQ